MSLKQDLARVEHDIQSVQCALGNLELGFTHHTQQVQTDMEPNYFSLVRRQRKAATDRRYWEMTHRLSDEWEHTDKPCACSKDHKAVRFKNGKNWYRICPIRYYLLLSWKAITQHRPVPSTETYWQLLGKEKPVDRSFANASTFRAETDSRQGAVTCPGPR